MARFGLARLSLMKITIVYRYFWPDTPPYATMLRDMSEWFVDAGHDVEVITAQPGYKPKAGIPAQPRQETINGVKIRRVRLLKERGNGLIKALNAAIFVISAFFILLFSKKRDLVWTATIPPVVQAFAMMVVSKIRGAKFLYHMQDIYPEIATVSGHISKLFPVKLFQWLDCFTQRRSEAIVVLSEDMKRAINVREVDVKNVSVINNFSLVLNDEAGDTLAKAPVGDEPVRFIFAGNVGRFQNLTALVDAFTFISPSEAILKIVGDGRAKGELTTYVQDNSIENVSFLDHMSTGDAFKELCKSHVGVVSLSPDIFQYAFPSKVLTYMAANLPILAMVEDESDLAQMLKKRNLGSNADWNSTPNEIASSIRSIILAVKTDNIKPAQEKNIYHPKAARERWLSLLTALSHLKDKTA